MTLRRSQNLLLVAIVLFAMVCRSIVLNHPFQRDPEGCAAFFGLVARNYFRYDLSTTYGIPVMSMGQGASAVFYANHPPTTPLLIAAVNLISGYRGEFDRMPGDWQVRLPTTLFTLGCIVAIYLLLKNRGLPRAGLIAAVLFVSIPMTVIYGGFADVISTHLVLMALWTVAAYERFHDAPGWKTFGWLALAFFAAAIVDWPAFHLVPVLGLHFVVTRSPRKWPWIVGFGLVSVAIFVGLYAYLTLGQENWLWMKQQFSRRGLSSAGDSASGFNFVGWLKKAIWEYAILRHTIPVCVLGLCWVVTAALRRFSGPADRLAGLLLGWALLHVLLGRQGVYQHEWWWWPLTPGLVIAAALVLNDILVGLESIAVNFKRWLNIAAAAVLCAFCVWNARLGLKELLEVPPVIVGPLAPLDYSLEELGIAVRTAVPPDAAAILAEGDPSLPVWYYADRAVKLRVWDLDTFQRRLTDKTADLTFSVPQQWNGRVSAMIVPKAYASSVLPNLTEYLEAHYQRRDLEKFIIYDLERPKPPG